MKKRKFWQVLYRISLAGCVHPVCKPGPTAAAGGTQLSGSGGRGSVAAKDGEEKGLKIYIGPASGDDEALTRITTMVS